MHETKRGKASLKDETQVRRLKRVSEDLQTITPDAIKARLWSVQDTATILGRISDRQVYRLLETGDLESRYIGSRRLIHGLSLHEYMQQLPSEPEEAA